jgi:hypothetical protein
MALNASIFIPDISGYTEFLSRTELEHSSHIINELLKVLVDSNFTDLTLAEIEGDALLFYRTGEPLSFDEMTRQAVTMFSNFHTRLKIIERDSICQCGACQTASNLSLKFVVHYGAIQEIRISNFVKASGIDMIIAHRLMKNSVPSQEYVLATAKYLDACAEQTKTPDLSWEHSSEEYPTVGTIPFQYALLDAVRDSIPPVPDRQQAVVSLDDRSVQIDIASPMMDVYQTMIDYNGRHHWIEGLRGGKGEQPIDRLNAKHFCYFDDFTVELVPVDRLVTDHSIRYVEEFAVTAQGIRGINEFHFESRGPEETHLAVQVGALEGTALPQEAADAVLAQQKENMEHLKEFCEKDRG